MIEILDRPGVWQRAGMAGVIIGLSFPEALAGLRDGLDRDLCRALLTVAEISYVAAVHEAAESETAKPTNY